VQQQQFPILRPKEEKLTVSSDAFPESVSSIQFLSEQANLALRMGPIEIFNDL